MDNNMTPKTPKQIKKAPIIIAAVVLLAVVIGFIFGPKIANAARKLFLSDSDYAAYVVESSVEETFDTVKQKAETYIEYAEKGVTADIEIEIALEKGGKKLLEDLGDIDEEYYEWFDNASISLNAAANPEDLAFSYGIDAKLNKKSIASMEMAVVDNTAYVSLPDYNKKAVSMELPEGSMPELPDIDLSPIVKALDLDLLEKIALNYTKVALGAIEAEEDSVSVSAGGVKGKLTESTVVLNAVVAKDVATAILDEAAKDKDLEKLCKMIEKTAEAAEKAEVFALFEDLTGESISADDVNADDMYDGLSTAIEMASNGLEAWDAEAEEGEVILSVYSDAEGNFAGMKICDNTDGEEILLFELYYVVSGSKAGFELNVYDGSEEETMFSVVGKGKESGDKLTAEFTISSYGEEMYTFETKNLDLNKLGDGFFVGELIFPVPDVPMFDDAAISLLSNCGDSDKVDLKLTLLDGEDKLASVSVKGSIKPGAKIKAPGSAIDATDEAEVMEWAEKTIEAVTKELPKKLKSAKLPDEFVSLIEDGLSELESNIL